MFAIRLLFRSSQLFDVCFEAGNGSSPLFVRHGHFPAHSSHLHGERSALISLPFDFLFNRKKQVFSSDAAVAVAGPNVSHRNFLFFQIQNHEN